MFAKEHEDEENMFDICIKVEDFYCVILCMDIVTSVVTVSKPKTAVFLKNRRIPKPRFSAAAVSVSTKISMYSNS